jgi:hypothetical protein
LEEEHVVSPRHCRERKLRQHHHQDQDQEEEEEEEEGREGWEEK